MTVEVPKDKVNEVRFLQLKQEAEATMPTADPNDEENLPDTTIICRCENITVGEVRKMIDQGYDDFDELKRLIRTGMGPCQGRTCRHLIMQEISRRTGKKFDEIELGAFRPPTKPIQLEQLIGVVKKMSNPKTANVVIVGGGISGVAIAWNLAKKGVRDIVVLEKKTVCSGATGRCGAGIRMQWGAEQNCLLAKMSVEFFENANEILEYDRDVEFDQGGYLIVAGNEKENELFKKNIALQNSLGIPSKHLTPQEA